MPPALSMQRSAFVDTLNCSQSPRAALQSFLFWTLGFQHRLVRRFEWLTLLPNWMCLPAYSPRSLLFITCDENVLNRRFTETRRRHPLSTDTIGLKEAIELEKDILSPISDIADRSVDTSRLTLHQLRDLIKNTIVPNTPQHMSILFESFGFKNGVPTDSDFVFDVRCLPNPYWKQQLKNKTGNDQGVIEFLESQVEVASMLADIIGFLTRWIPKFQQNNRSYLTVSIGCTGGQHRSVYLANRLHEHFAADHPLIQVSHKELSS